MDDYWSFRGDLRVLRIYPQQFIESFSARSQFGIFYCILKDYSIGLCDQQREGLKKVSTRRLVTFHSSLPP